MRRSSWVFIMVLAALPIGSGTEAGSRDAAGFRLGWGVDTEQFIVGGQAEVGPVIGPATLVPSLEVGLGDGRTAAALNLDLRWYLLPLPETGLYFYGSAGPTLVFASPGTELGLSVVGGVNIPMKNKRRYNLEARFGIGDIPDLKIMLGVMFDLGS